MLVQRFCGIGPLAHQKDCAFFREKILTDGNVFCSYEGEEVLAQYLTDEEGCVVRNGNIYSFGFLFGASYTAKTAPHVPLAYKNNAMYPVGLQKEGLLRHILRRRMGDAVLEGHKGLEVVVYENGKVIVNHTSHPVALEGMVGKKIFQYPVNGTLIMPHSAVFVEMEN